MPLRSPDELLIRLSDRLLAVPQRAGIPLPAVLAQTTFIAPAAAFVCGLSFLPLLNWGFMVAWFVGAMASAWFSLEEARELQESAASWTPRKAQAFRARALRRIEEQGRIRAGILACLAACLGLVCLNVGYGLPRELVVNSFSFTLYGIALGSMFYARCAMPHDPDLMVPVRVRVRA